MTSLFIHDLLIPAMFIDVNIIINNINNNEKKSLLY